MDRQRRHKGVHAQYIKMEGTHKQRKICTKIRQYNDAVQGGQRSMNRVVRIIPDPRSLRSGSAKRDTTNSKT